MIDLHSHVLPGLDDGAATLVESLAIARAAVADGVTVLAATPHVRDDYPTRAETMLELLAEVHVAIALEGIPLRLVGGGEVALELVSRLSFDELRRFGLAGNPGYLLVESPARGWVPEVGRLLAELRRNGITPVLAHPERNNVVQERPELLASLVADGVLVQVTAAAIDGRFGERARATACALVRQGLAHVLASDAHGGGVRQIGLSAAAAALGDPDLARWLTEGLPGAILRQEPLPERPATPEPSGEPGQPWAERQPEPPVRQPPRPVGLRGRLLGR